MPLGVVNGAAVNAAVINGSYPTLYGALSTTQAADVVLAAGAVGVVGDSSSTQSFNTLVAKGVAGVVGDLSSTQAGDTVLFAGVGITVGGLTQTQADDTSLSGGAVSTVGDLSSTQADDSVSASSGLLTVVQGAGLFRPIRSANTAVVVGSIVVGWDVVVLPPTSVIHIPVSTPYTAGRLLTSGEVLAPYFGLSTPVCRSAIVFKSKVSRPVAASNSSLVGGFVYSPQVYNAVGPRCGATVAIVSGRVYSGGNVVRPRAIRNPTMEQMMALFS